MSSLQRRDAAHLGARRELHLVARDARTRDRVDHASVDPEVTQRLLELAGDGVDRGRRLAGGLAGAAQDQPGVGQDPLPLGRRLEGQRALVVVGRVGFVGERELFGDGVVVVYGSAVRMHERHDRGREGRLAALADGGPRSCGVDVGQFAGAVDEAAGRTGAGRRRQGLRVVDGRAILEVARVAASVGDRLRGRAARGAARCASAARRPVRPQPERGAADEQHAGEEQRHDQDVDPDRADGGVRAGPERLRRPPRRGAA